MIGAGNRNKHITIQILTETVTDEGEVTETATTYARTWAAIEPLNSRETWQAQATQATTSHKITMLYMSGVTTRMQATWNGRTFKFDGVRNINEDNRELEIMATEVTD